MAEGRRIQPRPKARAAWGDRNDAAAGGQNAPDFGEQFARMFRDFERMNEKHAVDAAVGQRHGDRIDQGRGGEAARGPVHHALLGRHESQDPHRFGPENIEIGRGIANAKNRIAETGRKTLPDQTPDEPPGHFPQRRGIKRAEIDDIESHGVSFARMPPDGYGDFWITLPGSQPRPMSCGQVPTRQANFETFVENGVTPAMAAQIHQFLCLSDNFGVLLHDPATGRTASIDAPEAAPILQALEEKGWDLTDILVTHHHFDHIQGIGALKTRFPAARVAGPAKEAAKIGVLDELLHEGDVVRVGQLQGRVIEVPGHTLGHIAYYFESEALLFAGDTLFSLGCGRAFEAPAAVLHDSVMKLAALPGETQLYCGHEYTAANARFALSVDGRNEDLLARAADVERSIAAGRFTLPSSLALERATNPFLRATSPAIKASLGLPGDTPPADVFEVLRERKNRG